METSSVICQVILSFVLFTVQGIVAESTNTPAVPSPIVIPPSQYFEGNDGSWSSFDLRVGTPEQQVRVLPSTAIPQTMVVLADLGCTEQVFGMSNVPLDCAVSRGIMFNPNASSSWQGQGIFSTNQNRAGPRYVPTAEFGLETLGVGLVAGGSGPTLRNQIVATFATAAPLYLGTFGLNPQPVNFSSLGNISAPSYLTSLKEYKLIPSLSWSYTAGAIYRLKKVYGQLIFSGYDTSRFILNSVSFTMTVDVTRDLVVSLQAVTYVGLGQSSLLSSPINIFIDSTDPFLWLPSSACDAFEIVFGLNLDNATGLYLINETHHSILVSSKAEVKFQLSDILEGGDIVTISLPYRAFDLKAVYPLTKNSSYYFPLKRAINESQYTLGRTFLQEAYLTVDYERGRFSVSQCSWVEGADKEVVTILSKESNKGNDSTPQPPTESSTTAQGALSPGTIAGIIIGAIVAVTFVVAAATLLFRRKTASPLIEANSQDFGQSHGELGGDERQIWMVHADDMLTTPRELRAERLTYELPGIGINMRELEA